MTADGVDIERAAYDAEYRRLALKRLGEAEAASAAASASEPQGAVETPPAGRAQARP